MASESSIEKLQCYAHSCKHIQPSARAYAAGVSMAQPYGVRLGADTSRGEEQGPLGLFAKAARLN